MYKSVCVNKDVSIFVLRSPCDNLMMVCINLPAKLTGGILSAVLSEILSITVLVCYVLIKKSTS